MDDLPYCIINMAASVDGKITTAARLPADFTSREDRRRMDRLRASVDAILVGGATVRADDPPLYPHLEDNAARRRQDVRRRQPLLNVIVSDSLDLPLCGRCMTTGDVERLVITSSRAPATRLAAVKQVAEVVTMTPRLDFARLTRDLRTRGVRRLLVEGGGQINHSFLVAGLVNEIHVTLAPLLIGGSDSPTIVDGESFPPDLQPQLALLSCETVGDEVFLRYRVRR